jgi:peptidoglycan/LPS O-acetylase OafA/YrhL
LQNTSIRPTATTQHRFHLLDALRGVAAILVVPIHVFPAYRQILAHQESYIAVDFFFCLSGFVVAFSYERRLLDSMSFAKFFITRLLRLYPLAALGTLFGACELLLLPSSGNYAWAKVPSLMEAVMGFALIPKLSKYSLLFPLNPVLWTLFMELLVNAGYAVAVRFGAAKNWVLAIATILFLYLLKVEAYHFGTLSLGVERGGAIPGFLRAAASFCMGVAMMRLYRLTSHRRIGGVLAGGITAFVTAALIAVLCGPTLPLPLLLLTIGLLFPALIYLAAHVNLTKAWLPVCVFLGQISYPLYILHLPLVYPFFAIPFLVRFSAVHEVAANFFLIAFIALLTVGAWLAAKFYDTPVRTFLTGRVNKRLAHSH